MVARWLWDHLLLAAGLMIVVALGLVAALALGWNSPRPGGSPGWEAPGLPRRINAGPDRPVSELLGQAAGDFAFEVIIRPERLPESRLVDYGLIYRAQDPGNHYAFLVGADGYYAVARVEAGRMTFLSPWQQFPHIKRGPQSNRLLVSCVGTACSFRVNDEYVVTVEDDWWLSGEQGVAARSPEGEAVFTLLKARLWLTEE